MVGFVRRFCVLLQNAGEHGSRQDLMASRLSRLAYVSNSAGRSSERIAWFDPETRRGLRRQSLQSSLSGRQRNAFAPSRKALDKANALSEENFKKQLDGTKELMDLGTQYMKDCTAQSHAHEFRHPGILGP